MEGGEQLRALIGQMERKLQEIGAPPVRDAVAFLAYQRAQVDRLIRLEDEFRAMVARHHRGPKTYRRFLKHVSQGSILSARPYFRERQAVFASQISQALKVGDSAALTRFRTNYRFVRFVVSLGGWSGGLRRRAEEIERLRKEMVLLLLPLALNRARIFWSRTPRSHLSFLDLVQISSEGLLAAVDKFVPPFGRVFRAVAIGRMVGNLIEQYSETLVHFYPADKRKVYRANKAVGKTVSGMDGVDFDALSDRVNQEAEGAFKTSPSELAGLMSAASCVSTDIGPAGVRRAASRVASPEESGPDRSAERSEESAFMRRSARVLSCVERKFLALKGALEAGEVIS